MRLVELFVPSARAARALAALLALAAGPAAACRRTTPGGDAAPNAPAADPAGRHMPAAGVPLRPVACDYSVREVSPSHPRLVLHADRRGGAPAVRNLHITTVSDPATSMVVQWSTDAATLASEVRYGDGPERLDHTAQGYSFTYAGAPGRRQHEVHLCGLAPGHRYFYDAGGEGARTDVAAFVTAPAAPGAEVRLLVFGDARSNPEEWGRIATRAAAEHPDFLLFTGDAVWDGGNQRLWDGFFERGAALFATTPGVWADGNHEGITEVYYAQLALPDSGGRHRPEHWYAVTYGALRVIVLNDTSVPAREIAGIETEFLGATLATVDRARTPFVATVHHRPVHTTSAAHPSYAVTGAAWVPLFDRYGLDVDLAGHVHSYESTFEMRGHGVAPPGVRGTRYFNFGGAGAELYSFRPSEPWIQTRERTYGYAIITVSATRLRWDAFRGDGSRIETIDIPPR